MYRYCTTVWPPSSIFVPGLRPACGQWACLVTLVVLASGGSAASLRMTWSWGIPRPYLASPQRGSYQAKSGAAGPLLYFSAVKIRSQRPRSRCRCFPWRTRGENEHPKSGAGAGAAGGGGANKLAGIPMVPQSGAFLASSRRRIPIETFIVT